jgi:uncharacterized protein (DUF362 family)/Pyruvate/2-oxoacid:ferredoxin oxidoreductase delta subunit
MSRVAVFRCSDYDPDRVRAAVRQSVDAVGGLGAIVSPGASVLLKPNLVTADPPERCITTDPAVVLAVGEMVKEAGGRVSIADSPAIDPFKHTAKKTGMAQVAEKLEADVFPLTQPTRVDMPEGSVFKSLELSRQALKADAVINIPKLKTHGQMLLTLGVKNLFGCIVAQRKAEWHAMVGMNREAFANLLLDIYLAVKPALTVLDGVRGMEGKGPANGDPRHFGLIGASTDALALDLVFCRLLQASLRQFPIHRAAVNRKLIPADLDWIETVGDGVDYRDQPIQTPQLQSLLPLPGVIGVFMAKHLVSKPVHNPHNCRSCRKCIDVCASDAVELNDGRLSFDYDRCIRCYCCQEVCPEDAVGFRTGLLVRTLNRLGL